MYFKCYNQNQTQMNFISSPDGEESVKVEKALKLAPSQSLMQSKNTVPNFMKRPMSTAENIVLLR